MPIPPDRAASCWSKGEAEAAVAASGLDWTIVQPSVIFGRENASLNLFARLLRIAPVMALARADARFQPVYVGDVAECIVRAPRAAGDGRAALPAVRPDDLHAARTGALRWRT